MQRFLFHCDNIILVNSMLKPQSQRWNVKIKIGLPSIITMQLKNTEVQLLRYGAHYHQNVWHVCIAARNILFGPPALSRLFLFFQRSWRFQDSNFIPTKYIALRETDRPSATKLIRWSNGAMPIAPVVPYSQTKIVHNPIPSKMRRVTHHMIYLDWTDGGEGD